MKKVHDIIQCPKLRQPRHCDAKIHITDTIVLIEYSNGLDYVMVRQHPRAIKLVNFIKL